jgi:hypothetical protein
VAVSLEHEATKILKQATAVNESLPSFGDLRDIKDTLIKL